jgi:hypothetical protein
MNTFKKELTYLEVVGVEDDGITPKMQPTTKNVTFKELSQTDKSQGRIFFLMRPLFQNVKMVGGGEKVIADPNVLYDLIMYVIDALLIQDEDFSEQNKVEFLNDNFAVMCFGEWFLNEKASPFFFRYLTNYLFAPKSPTKP